MKRMLEHLFGPTGLIFLGALLTAVGGAWAAIQQRQFQDEIKQKSREIEELNQSIADSLLSKDSYCFLQIGNLAPDTTVGHIAIIHYGQNPLYDVHAQIMEIGKSDWPGHRVEIGNVASGSATLYGTWDLRDYSPKRYRIGFFSRHVKFQQLLSIRHHNGKWTQALQVKATDGTSLYRLVPDSYPEDYVDDIEW